MFQLDWKYLLSRTWRLTEADCNCAGRQVYFPESDSSACRIVSVLTVVPAAMCSGGVVCNLAPLWLPILRAEVASGRCWSLWRHSMYVGGTKLWETTQRSCTVDEDLTKMSRSPKIFTLGTAKLRNFGSVWHLKTFKSTAAGIVEQRAANLCFLHSCAFDFQKTIDRTYSDSRQLGLVPTVNFLIVDRFNE